MGVTGTPDTRCNVGRDMGVTGARTHRAPQEGTQDLDIMRSPHTLHHRKPPGTWVSQGPQTDTASQEGTWDVGVMGNPDTPRTVGRHP